MSYKSETQEKNLAWFLPRPHPSHYRGGYPLHCEKWLIELAKDILATSTFKKPDPKILTLFAGMSEFGFRVDIKPEVEPDLVCDVHELTKHIDETFDIIIADPPYSNDEAKELYDTPPLKYKTWTAEATELLDSPGLLIVYHKYVMPNPNPKIYSVVKRVFIGTRTYHVPRVATYFKKKSK